MIKLFTRYNRINLLATVIIFLLSGVAFYFLLNFILIAQVDDNLEIEQHEIQAYISKYDRLPETMNVRDQLIVYLPISKPGRKQYFKTSVMRDPIEKDEDPFRQLIFEIEVGGQWYQAVVAKSLEGTRELVQSIFLITVSTISLMLVVSLLINRILLRRLWEPFYNTLAIIRNFHVGNKQTFDFPASNIEEFALMNKTLHDATRKAQQDYLVLKEFTENASHEMQTPLAIIRSKLDLLIQEENLSEGQSNIVQSAYTSIQKLSKLNQSLLLLAKIENRQFDELSNINLKEKTREKLTEFRELWENQQLTVVTNMEDAYMDMNTELADILLNNLIGNTIRHNIPGGDISIELKAHRLEVSNSGNPHPLDKRRVFTRFYKSPLGYAHTGLGLSIIKQICDVSGFSISYHFEKDIHSFVLEW